MPNYSTSTANELAQMVAGCRVDRASAILAATQTLFTIKTGNILLTGFYGEIMVLIDAANTLAVVTTPSANADGYTPAATTLGSTSGDINTYVAGRMIYLPAVAGALTITGTCGACPLDVAPRMVLCPGVITLTSTGTTTLGKIRWSMFYIPLVAGAYVVSG